MRNKFSSWSIIIRYRAFSAWSIEINCETKERKSFIRANFWYIKWEFFFIHACNHSRQFDLVFLFKFLQRLWEKGREATEVVGPVRVIHRYVNMPEQSAEFYNETTKKIEEVNINCYSVDRRKIVVRIYSGYYFSTGARLRTGHGLQLRSWHHRRTRFFRLRTGNNDAKSVLERSAKFPGRPDRGRHSLSFCEAYFTGHRTSEFIFFFLFLSFFLGCFFSAQPTLWSQIYHQCVISIAISVQLDVRLARDAMIAWTLEIFLTDTLLYEEVPTIKFRGTWIIAFR